MQKKLVLLFVAIILAFAVLIGRITYINASSGSSYTKMVLDQQQYDSRVIPFKRGDIVDRNGTKIATSERIYNVILDAKVLLSDKKYKVPTIEVLKSCFDIKDEYGNGTKIATSERVYNVILDVKVMCSKEEYIEPTIQVLAECFGIEEEKVRGVMEESPSSRYSILLKGIDYNTAQRFEEIDNDEKNYPNVKGIWLEDDYIRRYPYNTLASDVIGRT